LAVDFRRGDEQFQGDRITNHRQRQKSIAKGVADRARLQTFESFLNNWATNHEVRQILLSQAGTAGQQIDPDRGVNEDYLASTREERALGSDRRDFRRGRSSRIAGRSASQIPLPKNHGRVWIFFQTDHFRQRGIHGGRVCFRAKRARSLLEQTLV
jgi:hypothetical protein